MSLAVLAGCATDRPADRATAHHAAGEAVRADNSAPAWEQDGPDPHPPPDLASVPDAEPEPEPIRLGGPNKPYEALGQTYVPIVEDRPYVERGLATWYGRKFHGHRTSSGEPYDMYAMTAAHPVLPIPSYAKVRNPANGREVIVRINDRGPFHSGRIIDLSYTAALKLGVLRGATPVEVQHITGEDIRTGAWRSPASPALAQAVAAPQPPSRSRASPASEVTGAPTPEPPAVAASAAPTTAGASTVAAAAQTDDAPPLPMAADGPDPPPVSMAPSTSTVELTAPTVPIAPLGPTPSAASSAAAPPPPAVATRSFWVQLGAFRQRDAADQFSRNVASGAQWLAARLAVAADAGWYRLRAGPYASVAEAQDTAERLRHDLQLSTMVLSRP